jgi:Tfp pilus assembly protein PilO
MKSIFKTSNYEKYYKNLVPYFKKEKNQKYFTIVLTLTASIFFILFAINPTVSTIINLRKQLADAKVVDEKLTQKINNLTALSQQYQNIQDDLPFIMDAIPQNPKAPELVGQIQSIGQESSVQINNVEIMPLNLNVTSSTKSSSFEFNVMGEGSFENVQSFISNLINMQRAVSVTSIQLTSSGGDENINFILKGLSYFKK